jgi:hypothetical protein
MMLTEEEARKRWCPMVRLGYDSNALATPDNRIHPKGRLAKNTEAQIHPGHRCIASGCMMWRWEPRGYMPPRGGYCGLAGRPPEGAS